MRGVNASDKSPELAASGSPARSSLVAGPLPNRPRADPPFPARGRGGAWTPEKRAEQSALVSEGLAVARYWDTRRRGAARGHMPFPGHRTQAQVAIDEAIKGHRYRFIAREG